MMILCSSQQQTCPWPDHVLYIALSTFIQPVFRLYYALHRTHVCPSSVVALYITT